MFWEGSGTSIRRRSAHHTKIVTDSFLNRTTVAMFVCVPLHVCVCVCAGSGVRRCLWPLSPQCEMQSKWKSICPSCYILSYSFFLCISKLQLVSQWNRSSLLFAVQMGPSPQTNCRKTDAKMTLKRNLRLQYKWSELQWSALVLKLYGLMQSLFVSFILWAGQEHLHNLNVAISQHIPSDM